MRHLTVLILLAGCADSGGDDVQPIPDEGLRADACDCVDAAAETDAAVDSDAAVDADAGVDSDAAVEPDSGADPDGGVVPDSGIEPDGATPDPDGATPDPDAGVDPVDSGVIEPMDRAIAGGDVRGMWCGNITLRGTVTVPAGEALTLCAGTTVTVRGDRATSITVVGTLNIRGTADAPVLIRGDAWRGLRVGGVLDAEHFELGDAANCIDGAPMSEIDVRFGRIERCDTVLVLANGGTFANTTMVGGTTVRQRGGMWTMTDSVLDLGHDTQSPDCTAINGGGLAWDHVHVTGCHCPIHINGAEAGVAVTNSVLDGSSYPIMISNTQASFSNTNMAGVDDHLLDVGGNFRAELAGNWYEGGAPRLSSGDLSQFVGADDWEAEPVRGAGPRSR